MAQSANMSTEAFEDFYFDVCTLGYGKIVKATANDTEAINKIFDSYEECFDGNKSSVHWDLVLMETPEYGGGEIWFDDKLIRKDGKLVLKELELLNPENLK